MKDRQRSLFAMNLQRPDLTYKARTIVEKILCLKGL